MSPWLFLGWVVAVAVSLIAVTVAIVVVIAAVRSVMRKPIERRRIRKTVGAH